ncbi:hypothetical protein E8E12_010098 [Didymella heteroderae]|uniref:AB hydrolase-1 domain-containing protein n=1 Tax=Didymella heteroderae TaxID=1769908 RepID=A0A9P4WWR4_9PLEO|nr:hypothetical protein E8E12_010098 [Didymella heteroderae]
MATKKPTIVLIPGSFLHSLHYAPTLQPLIDGGISVHVLDPPCYYTKKPGDLPTMYDDASFVATFIENLADQGHEVVLVSHSYGGTPASECMKGVDGCGLSVGARQKQGKRGGVVRLAYMTAVVPKVGGGLADTMVGGVTVPLEADEDGWLMFPDPSACVDVCFNSVSKEEGMKHFQAALGQHSSVAFADTLTYPGYKDVPASWFLCEDDRCVVPAVQETAIKDIEESWKGTEREGKRVDVTRVKCDHFPTVSAQGQLREWFEGLVEKGGQ